MSRKKKVYTATFFDNVTGESVIEYKTDKLEILYKWLGANDEIIKTLDDKMHFAASYTSTFIKYDEFKKSLNLFI